MIQIVLNQVCSVYNGQYRVPTHAPGIGHAAGATWAGTGRDMIITRIRTWHANQAPLNIPSTQPWYRTIHFYSMMRLWVRYLKELDIPCLCQRCYCNRWSAQIWGVVAAAWHLSPQWAECCLLQTQDTSSLIQPAVTRTMSTTHTQAHPHPHVIPRLQLQTKVKQRFVPI